MIEEHGSRRSAPTLGRAVREAAADGLTDWGLERFVHVPSSHVAALIRALLAAAVAAGVALRHPGRVTAIEGDGSLLMGLSGDAGDRRSGQPHACGPRQR
jgi:phytoene dehydrogenase-like protein